MTTMPALPQTRTTAMSDGHGNPMTGDAATIELYDRAVDRLVRFHPEVGRPRHGARRCRRPGTDGPRPVRLPAPDEHGRR